MRDYLVNVFYSDKDGGRIADIPGAGFCSAFAEASSEALTEMMTARIVWIASVKKHRKPIAIPPVVV